ncbi:MAG: iron export ABC transporter permease subunit FetB [Deltaproteobacteria bacterium]|nr:MAG: iron export ABC transporter permease subunit FetB [Deltaproteobacteria bacterium]
MNTVSLTSLDLGVAALLLVGLALTSWRLALGLEGRIFIAALRTVLQLLLIGLVLKALFAHVDLLWLMLIALVMLAAAGREVVARQKYRLEGGWAFFVGSGAMFVSSFSVALLALTVVIRADPWYAPRYAIPLLGMLLGNTMNGIALAMNHLNGQVWQGREMIEQRLMLGQTRGEAIADLRRESMRTGMIPIMNAMAAAGIVSLPGMMTGQILAGAPPTEAVRYQILIMFLITAGTGFGTITAIAFTTRHLFDARHRLRIERLQAISSSTGPWRKGRAGSGIWRPGRDRGVRPR